MTGGELLLSAPEVGQPIGTGESVAFWVLGTVAVLAALGVVFSRKAVYSALMLAGVMLTLAVFYGIQQAPFLMVVQIVVYTGAVLMLFLFVLMLVGVSSADSLVETIRGQRVLAAIVALGFLGALSTGLAWVIVASPIGLDAGEAAAGGNVPWIATEVFHRYVIAFEATGALLIVAVLGALVLAHQERLGRRRTQRELSKERMRGDHPSTLPGPGTYARHNAIDMPALLPDGTVATLSVNPVLAARSDEPPHAPPSVTSGEHGERRGDDTTGRPATGDGTEPHDSERGDA